jgi:hypothetical protein
MIAVVNIWSDDYSQAVIRGTSPNYSSKCFLRLIRPTPCYRRKDITDDFSRQNGCDIIIGRRANLGSRDALNWPFFG